MNMSKLIAINWRLVFVFFGRSYYDGDRHCACSGLRRERTRDFWRGQSLVLRNESVNGGRDRQGRKTSAFSMHSVPTMESTKRARRISWLSRPLRVPVNILRAA